MQRTEIVEFPRLEEIVGSIFEEPATAYEDYSEFDSELKEFDSKEAVLNKIESAKENGAFSVNFAIYYPAANGYFYKEKKSLNPEKCNGATYRYVANGWGLIHLQIDLRDKEKPEVRVAVNTLKRATAWEPTYPELKAANLWDWKLVEKQARRLINVLKKCA
jgi:hypothetical protein